MFCSNCGNQIEDGSGFCPFCGAAQNTQQQYTQQANQQQNTQQAGQQQYYQQSGGQPNQQYQQVNQQYQQYQQPQSGGNNDSGDFWWAIPGFLIPLVGLVIFFIIRKDKPASAKMALIGAGVGAAFYLVLQIF